MFLYELQPGESGIVTHVDGSGELTFRLLEMGIIRGTKITVDRLAPLGDPMVIAVQGFILSLRKTEAAMISVKKELKKGLLL